MVSKKKTQNIMPVTFFWTCIKSGKDSVGLTSSVPLKKVSSVRQSKLIHN